MGTILKGIQSVLIALGIIAIVGTGVILYYNTIKPETEETAAAETESQGEETQTAESETEAARTEDTGSGQDGADGTHSPNDTAASVFTAENGHEHTYTSTVLRPATCTEAGEVRYDCYCGDYYIDAIPALEHKAGQWITVRAATSTQTGLRQKSCTICGRTLEEETIPMLPADTNAKKTEEDTHKHVYTYEITTEATCTAKGEKTYTCTKCGSTFKTSIPATNHPSRSTVRTEGNCGEPGKIETKCNICGAVISSETLNYDHKWGSWTTTTAATTTSEGVQTRTCSKCGKTETKSIAKLSGSSGNGSSGNGSSGSGSSGSGSSGGSGTAHTHSYTSVVTTQATCTSAGVTTYTCSCGASYTEAAPAALGHLAGNWVIIKPASTTETGQRVKYCTRCGEIAVTEELAMLPQQHIHTYVTSIIRDATCTASGTKKHACSSCGYYYTSTIPPSGHRDVNPADGKCDICGSSM